LHGKDACTHGKVFAVQSRTAMSTTATLSLPRDVLKLHGKGFALCRFFCYALPAFAVRAAFVVSRF
jgi:hypothetical protein